MFGAVEARVGQNDEKGQTGAKLLLPMYLVLGILTRLVKLDRLDEVRYCFLEALAHCQGQAMGV